MKEEMVMKSEKPRYILEVGDNARQTPVRLVVVQGDRRPPVDATDEPMVMTMPHLLLREGIALVGISLALAVLAIFIDAPLEEIANPQKTPNPSKAPWYFLGLQELLHYYPPIFSGVLLPGLVILALIVIPYFNINLKREALWREGAGRKLLYLWLSVGVLSAVFLFTGAHPVWPIVIPLWVVAALMTWPAVRPRAGGLSGWLGDRSLSFWIFVWFLLVSTALTVIGVLFRGPGWEFTLPWRDGIY
jgi:menaquinol-cytochrome c reductase cytochrome b/c subunit